MANAVIGALRVSLGLDSAQFQTGLKNSQTSLQRFGVQVAKFAAVAGAAMGAALTGVAVGVKRTVDEMDELAKAAQQFGIPVEELSKLKHAADLSGVSLDGLGTAVGRLSRNMSDVAAGAGAEASRAFDLLGISVRNADGTLKSSTQVLTELSDRFARLPDGAQKTALAMQLMGRSGATMIPMLNGGAAALNEMMAEAEALGLVFDEKTGQAAERFNDNLTRLGRVKDGLFVKITAKLVPALDRLADRFVAFAKDGDAVDRMANGVAATLQFVAREAASLSVIVQRLQLEFAGLAAAWDKFWSGDFTGAWGAFIEGQQRSAELAAQALADVDAIFSDTAASTEEAAAAATQSAMVLGDAAAMGLDKAAAAAQAAAEKIAAEAGRIFEATRTPAERYAATIARLNELLAQGAIDQDTYNRAVLQAQDAFDTAEDAANETSDAIGDIGQSLQNSLSGVFDRLIDGTFNARDAIAGLLSDLAKLLVNKAFTALLGGGSGDGGLLGSLFGGLKLPSAEGGGFTGTGPRIGGLDGKGGFLSLLHPNETVVDHTQSGGPGGGEMNVNIVVSGNGDKELMERMRQASAELFRQGLRAYDRDVIPGRVTSIASTGLRRGDIR